MSLQKLIERLRKAAEYGVLSDFEAKDVKALCECAEVLRDELHTISCATRFNGYIQAENASAAKRAGDEADKIAGGQG